MAHLDPFSVYNDPILTNFSVGFDDQTLIATQLAPITPVALPSGKYRVFNRANWLIFPDGRDPGTVANEVRGAVWSQDTYLTHEHSLQAAVTDEEQQVYRNAIANAQSNLFINIDPKQDATELVTRAIMLRHEKLVADTARNLSNYVSGQKVTLSGTSQWDNQTPLGSGGTPNLPVSDPVNDIMTGIRAVYRAVRRLPNVMIMPWNVASFIENHPRIVQRFQNFTLQSPEAFRLLTGFNGRIVLAESMYNAADNIDASPNITTLWGNDVILAVVDDSLAQNTQTFLKTFAMPYDNGQVRTVDTWREEPRKSDLVRVSMKYDLKIVSPSAGYFIQNAVAYAGN
ncbi:MAG TPA: hypothetical protein VF077_05710 [Nitrospiraceae bacterium]